MAHMIGLTYISMAIQPITPDILENILRISRQFNSQHAITGVLLYRDIFFVQYLEGMAQDVDGLFASIANDPLHTNVTLLYRDCIEERIFPNWWMGVKDVSTWPVTPRSLFDTRTLRDLLDNGSQSRSVMAMRAFVSEQGAQGLFNDYGTALG